MLLTTGLIAVMSVNIAACNSKTDESELDTVNTNIEQSAATTVLLETISTETTPSSTPTPTATPTPSLAPEEMGEMVL